MRTSTPTVSSSRHRVADPIRGRASDRRGPDRAPTRRLLARPSNLPLRETGTTALVAHALSRARGAGHGKFRTPGRRGRRASGALGRLRRERSCDRVGCGTRALPYEIARRREIAYARAARARSASTYELRPKPAIVPIATAAITDVCLNRSRVAGLEMCTSISGARSWAQASRTAYE
jgi:hypothetical protein